MMRPLLKIEGLSKNLLVKNKPLPVIHPLNLEVFPGETLGLIGESGCGKSTLGKLILRLIPHSSGRVYFEGTDILSLNSCAMKNLRRHMQMIFQDPFSSLNPRMHIQEILSEPYEIHQPTLSKNQRHEHVLELLKGVGIDFSYLNRLPHELSGGQKQRIGIARALAVNPKFIVCDEPLSALDALTQHQILALLIDLQKKHNLTYLFISHQLKAIKQISHRIAVMYLGRIVELSPSSIFFQNPLHPYSKSLLLSTPIPDPLLEKNKTYQPLQGEIPSFMNEPSGCPFHTRCPKAMPICRRVLPPLQEVYKGSFTACHFPE
jgi:oligopeptide transport system ATP-binding protein